MVSAATGTPDSKSFRKNYKLPKSVLILSKCSKEHLSGPRITEILTLGETVLPLAMKPKSEP